MVAKAVMGVVALLGACAHGVLEREAGAEYVVEIDGAAFDRPLPADANALQMREILLGANRYALTTWYDGTFGGQHGTYLQLASFDEQDVRPAASEAFALAVSLRTQIYDPQITGVSADDAESCAGHLLTSLAASHLANRDDGWGDDWQTALWAAYAGTAGWLLWDALSPDDARMVGRMVELEAMRFVDYQVPYYRDAHGEVVSSGDSKAEENAWNAQLLYLAVNMMPEHPQRAAWEGKAAELAISSYARPSALESGEIVNGHPLSVWLAGSNANADGAVINHNIVHPDYIATAAYTASAPLWYGLARRPTPDAMFVGTTAAYATLTDTPWDPELDYEDTSCLLTPCACSQFLRCTADAPGGTIYVAGSDEIYFPHGNDWGNGRRMNYAMFDALADAFALDTESTTPAAVWEARHGRVVLDSQRASHDRRAYTSDAEDSYQGREAWVAVHAAMGWLAKYVVAQGVHTRTDIPLAR